MAELAKMYPPQANTPETSMSGALTAAGVAARARWQTARVPCQI